jgi:hypothetical protein
MGFAIYETFVETQFLLFFNSVKYIKKWPLHLLWCHDTLHNDILHKDTQHNDTQYNDTQHNDALHNDTQHNGTQNYDFA